MERSDVYFAYEYANWSVCGVPMVNGSLIVVGGMVGGDERLACDRASGCIFDFAFDEVPRVVMGYVEPYPMD